MANHFNIQDQDYDARDVGKSRNNPAKTINPDTSLDQLIPDIHRRDNQGKHSRNFIVPMTVEPPRRRKTRGFGEPSEHKSVSSFRSKGTQQLKPAVKKKMDKIKRSIQNDPTLDEEKK